MAEADFKIVPVEDGIVALIPRTLAGESYVLDNTEPPPEPFLIRGFFVEESLLPFAIERLQLMCQLTVEPPQPMAL